MSLLKVLDLSQCFMEKELYNQASFDLYKGEHVGIVGQNGAGKSTLIRILMDVMVADSGKILWQPNIRIGHLDQYAEIEQDLSILAYLRLAFAKLYDMEKEMTRLYEESANDMNEALLMKAAKIQDKLMVLDFYTIDQEVNKVINGLGIQAIGVERPILELSGGQRAKVILAKLLLEKPDVLLLDEPTNFLDKEHVSWLSNYLSAFEGAFMVVSHDFVFLENVTTSILDIEFGTIKKYHGSYSEFLKQKAHLREDYIRQYESQQKVIQKTESFIRKNIAGGNSSIAKGRRKQLERMERIDAPSFVNKPTIRFKEIDIVNTAALVVKELEVGYYYALLPKISFAIQGGEKLVITGFNGIGKSTLLKTLLEVIPKLSGEFNFSKQVKVAYYEQDLHWEKPSATPIELISDRYPRMTIKEIRQALAKCAVKDDLVERSISTLSGGEQSKVKLCGLLLDSCNFLILDEPTNHLDAETKEALQIALKNFKGSMILVSHEEKFYKGWIHKVFNIEKC